ncbi:MAG: thiamine phosphate synthase [Myxococcales bacterium]|nr:thiamine phosphate synthase [Myxococcales bacterium]
MSAPPPLVAITPGDGRPLLPWIRALARGGLPGLLIREPHASDDELRSLWRHASDAIGWVAVHARHPLAHALPGVVHVSAAMPRPEEGPWGRSCHRLAQVDAAFDAGASYALWSPVWPPTSKPDDVRAPIGLDAFLAGAAGRPVLALGGVTPERFATLRAHGAGAAVLGGLFGVADPSAASERTCRYLQCST